MDIRKFFPKAPEAPKRLIHDSMDEVIGDATYVDESELEDFHNGNAKFKRIMKVVLEHSVNKENFYLARKEWVAAGGSCVTLFGSKRKYAHCITTDYYHKHFEEKFALPEHKDRCPCNTPIQHNCYIYNASNGNVLVIGNCCVKLYIPEAARMSCSACGQTHKNPEMNMCASCIAATTKEYRDMLNTKFMFGAHKTKTVAQVYKEDKRYIMWMYRMLLKSEDTFWPHRIQRCVEKICETPREVVFSKVLAQMT